MAGQGKYMKLPVRVIILTFPLKVEKKSRKISDRVFHIVKKKTQELMKQHIVISFIQNGVNFPNFVNGK